MTGFGRASVEAADRRLRVEMRSVNHRGLDIKVRGSELDAYCEVEVARAIRGAVERGAVTVHVRDESNAGAAGVDEARVRGVFEVLERLRQELEIDQPVDLATVGAFMTAGAGVQLDGESLWQALRPAVADALAELVATRAARGRGAGRRSRGATARSSRRWRPACARRRRRCPTSSRAGWKTGSRCCAARRAWMPGRIAQEVALAAERLDVAEELVRLDTHLEHFRELLAGAGAVGRKLDFVIQEIGRELNTIGSKSQDAGVAALVIEAKSSLERMREQAQNVE